ncbi:Signal transduction histidine kinase [Mucilaginibacter sp. OK268]|uniref:hybrid sensor histidine kinase/response regulator transcription factor n=1 Tax=Mucilaginibacter sp. OK268 TaxID=1881048 RepID=UPI0008860974|nr:hybrid sensor histidine kinase/response regulator transcription factor [Mucilaginibacter sp. OK268]SDP49723.1 Signal transduction histidine kinase [Mucilaginibacter sp. OK268]
MKYKISLCVLFTLFISHLVLAQSEQYQFSQLSIANGLSHNQVTCIYRDSKGFMWFGTLSGLNRYDGYKFKIFKHNDHDPWSLDDDFIVRVFEGPSHQLWVQTHNGLNIYNPLTEHFEHNVLKKLSFFSIPDSLIRTIKKDRLGNFWFLPTNLGVYKFNAATKKVTHFVHKSGDTTALYSNATTDIAEDSHGDFWLAQSGGVLEKLDHKSGKITQRVYNISKLNPYEKVNLRLFIDKQNDLWAFDTSNPVGVYYISPSKNEFKHIDKSSPSNPLNADLISDIIQDDKNMIWIATDHGGIDILNKSDFKIQYLVNREDDSKSLGQNSTISIYKDNSGIIWVGTYKQGVSYYHDNIIKFPLYKHHLTDPHGLAYNDVNKFAEDDKGNLWIGTNGKGLIYFNRQTGIFTSYLHDAANTNSLANNVIVCLWMDYQKKLWIGTYYGGLDCYDGKTFRHYRHKSNDESSLSDDRVWELMEDSSHNLWVGTLDGGLNLLNREKNIFLHYKADQPNSVSSNYISGLIEDEHHDIWIATSMGVSVMLHQSHRFIYYHHSDKDKNSLINDNVNNLTEDSRHLIWLATREGLSIFDPATKKFTNFKKDDGLPDNTILDVLEDNNHNMWISTTSGLSNVIVKSTNNNLTFRFVNYDETDGLQGRAFNENASLKTTAGELIFGGPNGFNLFKPSIIKSNKTIPGLVLTDFQVFNKSLSPGEDLNGHIILSKSITETTDIALKYNENAFAIEFASLNFFNPGKVKLKYKLEGFDKGWTTSDIKIRKATYTNLDPGDYIFKVKAAGEDDIWRSEPLTLKIKILPPFWKTGWAYFIYALSFIGALFYVRHRGVKKIETKYALEHERQEAQRMHELDMMKIKFFTNVSHEFRTPLSLIIAPVDKMLKHAAGAEQREQLQMVNRNARRLLNMVNQLLDFRKMEVQELKLHARSGDIISFIKEMAYSFSDIAEKKHIRFVFDSETESMVINFDQDKIERIIFNLLSNAFKFTLEGGHVSVLLTKVEKIPEGQFLEIKVMDTGIGIPLDKQDKIFERFFQSELPGSMVNQGSGIGLSITREFVKLHHGEISVESEPGQGSYFTVLLPASLPAEADTQTLFAQSDITETIKVEDKDGQRPEVNRTAKKVTVLLVEDNEDFRFYLKDNLNDIFHIIEASNGKEGWQKTLALHPNLVVSDITMPEMSGIDLCRKIRNDKRTSHIPVVLLTALTGEEQQLQGLETGANDYLTKPFNFEILLSKLKNILAIQEDMRKTYQKQLDVKPTAIVAESFDEAFIKKVLLLIEKNMANGDFSVEELSSELCVSRVTLYKRALALTGKSPVELIRSIRLKRAAQLLESGHLTISQISYKVGFKSQKYFVRSFKAEFNCLPSAYINNKNKQHLNETH